MSYKKHPFSLLARSGVLKKKKELIWSDFTLILKKNRRLLRSITL